MQTALAEQYRNTVHGQRAETILRSCVHCGFCTATCPTYQLLGDELDGPRGRIYQIKQILEGEPASAIQRGHLDRCLTCRACETTCPSGVRYGELLEIGRELVELHAPRPLLERTQRKLLIGMMSNSRRFGVLLRIGQLFRPLLPRKLKQKVPPMQRAGAWPAARHARRKALRGEIRPPWTAVSVARGG